MEMSNIRKYAELMKEMELTALEVREDGSIRMERSPASAQTLTSPAAHDSNMHMDYEDETGITIVASPMVGMFYIAPAENAEPFVKVGSVVHKDDVLCIIEAMKLMNEITADVDGEIIEVLAVNGAVIEFGQPLFRIKRRS